MNYRFNECDGYFTTPNGTLTSPAYPEKYPGNIDCIYTILQRPGTYITVTILSMDIEYMSEYYETFANYDYHQYGGVTCATQRGQSYLEIRDGATESSPLIDGYCGDSSVTSLPIQIQSTQNNVWMR